MATLQFLTREICGTSNLQASSLQVDIKSGFFVGVRCSCSEAVIMQLY